MIVRKPLNVKVLNTSYRLSVGQPLPEALIKFYTDNGQLKRMIKSGVIEDDKSGKGGKSGNGSDKKEKTGNIDIEGNSDELVRQSEEGQPKDTE